MHQWTEDEQLNVPMKEIWCYSEVVNTHKGMWSLKKSDYFELIGYVF